MVEKKFVPKLDHNAPEDFHFDNLLRFLLTLEISECSSMNNALLVFLFLYFYLTYI